jgi:hypothetical protein
MLKRIVAAAILTAMAVSPAAADDRAVVIEWNQLLQSTVPGTAGLQTERYFAMLHIAMFDAVNSIERRYVQYVVKVDDSHGASSEAAAAQAAHDVLSALFPASKPAYDSALAARLATIPPGLAQQGSAVGAKVAKVVLDWRQNDGWAATPPPYVLPLLTGLWQPTPPPNAPAAFTQYPKVKPFATLSSTQFLHEVPPTLTSARYATDLNEVKEIGAVGSLTRTDDQTLVARLWATVVTPTSIWAVWNNVARDAVERQGLDLLDTARIFVLLNVSIHDGLQTAHTGKFIYGLWRPVTAIRRAGEDLNPLTDADPAWLPLITTPAYPSYPGNMACVGASAATALALGLGTNDIPVKIVWRNLTGPDYVREYSGLWQAALEQGNARVYGGIHYRFDNDASQEACPKVAGFVYANYMRPR